MEVGSVGYKLERGPLKYQPSPSVSWAKNQLYDLFAKGQVHGDLNLIWATYPNTYIHTKYEGIES